MKIGISGHRYRIGADWHWTRMAIAKIFHENPKAVGWSSLAIGADQIFAETALLYGKGHVAVIPLRKMYKDEFVGLDRYKYLRLKKQSHSVVNVKAKNLELAYRRAGERIVSAVDLMVFVWDGRPARGEGGTGQIVEFAQENSVDMVLINPIAKEIECAGT